MLYKRTTFQDLDIGQTATFAKTITEADIGHFVAITGDVNPLHVDAEFAANTFFGQRVVHGMLSASLFSTMVGMHLPGIGAIYRSQTIEFKRPVYIGDTLTALFTITRINSTLNRIEIDASIENQHGQQVISGQAVASLMR